MLSFGFLRDFGLPWRLCVKLFLKNSFLAKAQRKTRGRKKVNERRPQAVLTNSR
jgi:hypothetical protein